MSKRWWNAARLVLGLFGAPLAAHAGTVWVSVPERAEPCDLSQLASALRARLPQADVLPGNPGPIPGSAQVTVSRAGDEWSLEVETPDQPPLRRPLPAPGGDCVALTETAALMVDRYLAGIQWSAGAAVVTGVAPLEPLPSTPWRGWIGLGLGGGVQSLGLSGQANLAPEVMLEPGLGRGPWLFGVTAMAQLAVQVPLLPDPNQAALNEQFAAAQLVAGRRFELGPGALSAEFVPGLELFWVWATGTKILHKQGAFATVRPFLGARVGYELALSQKFRLSLRVEGRARLGQDSFEVQGYTPPAPALVTRTVDGDASLALSYLLF